MKTAKRQKSKLFNEKLSSSMKKHGRKPVEKGLNISVRGYVKRLHETSGEKQKQQNMLLNYSRCHIPN